MKTIVVTTDEVPGFKITRQIGVVWASSSRSKSILTDFAEVVRSIFGGELHSYKRMLNHARLDVLTQLSDEAAKKGANAVVGIRFGSTQILPATVDIFAYGTAVVVKKS
ncbi:MAG: YbjQ family protein [Candidatus Micrarchaeota archaeon]